MSNTVELNNSNFDRITLESDKPVLVDFWATWCGPCKMLAPTIEQVAQEVSDRLVVAKLDVDKAAETAQRFNIQGVPTLILFKDGKIIDRQTGFRTKKQILDMLDR